MWKSPAWPAQLRHAMGLTMAELEMMTVKEVADYLKMKPVTIYKLAKEGRIPAFKVASFWRFKKDLIEKWAVEESKRNLKPAAKRVGEPSEVS
jgi:excisionase family DNA binding protein